MEAGAGDLSNFTTSSRFIRGYTTNASIKFKYSDKRTVTYIHGTISKCIYFNYCQVTGAGFRRNRVIYVPFCFYFSTIYVFRSVYILRYAIEH